MNVKHQRPPKRQSPPVRPLGAAGAWQTSDFRYRCYARELFSELLSVVEAISRDWPPSLSEGITSREQHPDLWDRCDHRDRLSDSVRVYAAMSIEGFVNFYGVLRLGQSVYERKFLNKPLFHKLQSLLHSCDGVQIEPTSDIAIALQVVARSRNSLVHPSTQELAEGKPAMPPHVPGEAHAVIAAMEAFFAEFKRLVPEAAFVVDRG